MFQNLKAKAVAAVPSLLAAVRPAVITAAMTFAFIFGASLVGWLETLSGWLSALGTPEASEFPDPSVLGEGLVAAVAAAGSGLVNFVVRAIQGMLGKGRPPQYPAA